MRNIFDQYSQPENRVTHALMTAINEDRKLRGLFLRELVKVKPPVSPSKLSVLEQQLPGQPDPVEEEPEQHDKHGIPDGWIFDEEGRWCLFIESKVLAKVSAGQIRRHWRTAEGLGFQSITAVAIAPLPQSLPAGTVLLEWRTVYAWLRRHGGDWADRAADYLEVAEAKLIDSEQLVGGTLTTFTGFPFGGEHTYTYLEAKRLLRLALDELRTRRDLINQLGMKPELPSSKAIAGRYGYGVWDFLWLFEPEIPGDFRKYPHLTLSVHADHVGAMVTVPNAVNKQVRRNLEQLGEDGFRALIEEVNDNLEPLVRDHEGAKPWCYGTQRRWKSRSAPSYEDALIRFDLRTAISASGPPETPQPKKNPHWLSAAYATFVDKKSLSLNYQMGMGVDFFYEHCPELGRPDDIELIAKAWLACKPLVDLARRG